MSASRAYSPPEDVDGVADFDGLDVEVFETCGGGEFAAPDGGAVVGGVGDEEAVGKTGVNDVSVDEWGGLSVHAEFLTARTFATPFEGAVVLVQDEDAVVGVDACDESVGDGQAVFDGGSGLVSPDFLAVAFFEPDDGSVAESDINRLCGDDGARGHGHVHGDIPDGEGFGFVDGDDASKGRGDVGDAAGGADVPQFEGISAERFDG